MTIELANGQYEINGLVFGTRDPRRVPNPYLVSAFDLSPGTLITGAGGNLSSSSGASGTTTADASYPNEDGIKFGQDYYTGMLITMSIDVWQRGEQVYDDIGRLKGVWKDPKLRQTSNAVTTLRMCRGGRTRLVYGRPRNFKETYGEVEQGWSPIDVTFQCSDECFYSDQVYSKQIGMINLPVDGLTFPSSTPFKLNQTQEAYTTIHVEGDYNTWPEFIIRGPVVNPTIQFDDDWKIQLVIALNHTEYAVIDPRPWRRLTLKRGVGTNNISGAYTQSSPTMRKMKFTPGQHTILFGGEDPTLTSRLEIYWRNAYATP